MPGQVKLNKKDLLDLIIQTEQSGNDASELRKLLDEASQGKEKENPEPQTIETVLEGNRPLYTYVLGLFVAGDVTEEMLESMAEYDAKYSVSKVQKMLEERQLSTVGQKHHLCARLLADEKGWGKA